jgi:hypothetical protein
MHLIIDGEIVIWTGGYSCPGEEVAVLVCLSTSGHHGSVAYQWYRNDHVLDFESHPVFIIHQLVGGSNAK